MISVKIINKFENWANAKRRPIEVHKALRRAQWMGCSRDDDVRPRKRNPGYIYILEESERKGLKASHMKQDSYKCHGEYFRILLEDKTHTQWREVVPEIEDLINNTCQIPIEVHKGIRARNKYRETLKPILSKDDTIKQTDLETLRQTAKTNIQNLGQQAQDT